MPCSDDIKSCPGIVIDVENDDVYLVCDDCEIHKRMVEIINYFKKLGGTELRSRVVNIKNEACDIYIGRPSKWGNPFKISKNLSREKALEKYKAWIMKQPELLEDLPKLKGKRLGCYCKPLPCHGDVLVELIERRVWDQYPEEKK